MQLLVSNCVMIYQSLTNNLSGKLDKVEADKYYLIFSQM